MTDIALPENPMKSIRLDIQAEYMGLYELEEVSPEQSLWRGKLIPTSRKGRFESVGDRTWFYFSREYDPESNDLDKVFKELEIDNSITGFTFFLVPANKIRMFFEPESMIKLAKPTGVLV